MVAVDSLVWNPFCYAWTPNGQEWVVPMDAIFERLLVAIASPVATLALAAIAGQRITSWWNERQKRRELELALANRFYDGYGEFCAIWKQWNYIVRVNDKTDEAYKRFLQIHERACHAEGEIESVLLKIASEREMTDECSSYLGDLRQAFQILREKIERGQPLSYSYAEHPEYLAFKRLSTFAGNLLASKSAKLPTAERAFANFKEITDNKHESQWRNAGK